MAPSQLRTVLQHLRRLIDPPMAGRSTDGQLLERFARGHDEGAFIALVDRYGPMVLGVCQRVLRQPQDAEDAFQATFLVLVRKAGTLDTRRPLANWLYTVAVNTARKARSSAQRRRRYEGNVPPRDNPDQPDVLVLEELRAVLDSELSRLPEKYRAPLVLCYLEGKTNEEAARQLGWTKGTVSGRLARARELLRQRLVRRGLALSGAAFAAQLEAASAGARVSAALAATTAQAALIWMSGSTGAVSVPVATLAQGVLRAMLLTKVKITTAIVLTVTVLGAGATQLTRYAAAQPTGQPLLARAEDRDQPAPENAADWMRALQDPDPAARRKAAAALGALGPAAQPAVLSLIYALKDEDAQVRRNAADALGKLGQDAKAAIPVLLTAMRDKDTSVRPHAMRAVFKIGIADDGDRLAYVTALESLGKVALPILHRMVLDGTEKFFVRERAAEALGRLGPDAKTAVPALAKLLENVGKGDRGAASAGWHAAAALAAIGPAAAEAVPALLDTIKREQNDDNRVLVQTLGAIGPAAQAAVPWLKQQLQDRNVATEPVSCYVALSKIDPAALDPALLELLVQRPNSELQLQAAERLLREGRKPKVLISSLTKLLRDDSSYNRADAARLLGEVGPPAKEVVPLLIAAVDDPQSRVRTAAYRALQSIDPAGAKRIPAPKSDIPFEIRGADDLRRYALARRDAAQETLKACWNEFLAGRGTLNNVLRWSRNVLESQAAVSDTKEQRLAAFQAHRDRMSEVEKINRLRYEAGRIPITDMAAAEFSRLEADIWLAEERMK